MTRTNSTTAPPRDPDALRQWAATRITRATQAGPIPAAGTTEWCALDNNDPRKAAAVILAAITHLEHTQPAAMNRELLALADRLAVTKLRNVSRNLSSATTWTPGEPFCVLAARRTTYAKPPLTPEQIRARAAQPWSCDRNTQAGAA